MENVAELGKVPTATGRGIAVRKAHAIRYVCDDSVMENVAELGKVPAASGRGIAVRKAHAVRYV